MEFPKLSELFGAGPLKKVAEGNIADPPRDRNFKAATVSDAQRNQDYADKRLGKSKSPLASPMTPHKSPKTKGK